MSNVPSHPGRLFFGAVILGVTGVALAPSGLAGASSPTCMGIVLDYGTPSSPPSAAMPPATATQAASVASGTSDEQALADAGDSIGTNTSGLVCVINGYPANGVQNCTANSDNKFYFWSYWQGNPATNTWTYANTGPASHTIDSGDTYVEGWRYQNPGPANPSASPPSVTPAAAFAQTCPGVTPVANAGGGSTTATTNPNAGSGGETSTTQPSAPAASGTGTGGAAVGGGSGSGQSAGGTSTTAVPPAGGGATTTTAPSGGPTTSVTSKGTSKGGTPTPGKGRGQLSAPPLASHGGGGSASGVLALVIAGLVVAALVGGAIFRWRRRPASE